MILFNQTTGNKPVEDLYPIRDKLLKASVFACDLETTGFAVGTDSVTLVALAAGDEGWALNTLDYTFDTIWEVLKPAFDDPEKTAVYHNANFDLKWFHAKGFYPKNKIADTMIMAWLVDEDVKRYGAYKLKHCVLKELNHKMANYDEATSLFGDMDAYATDDALQTLRLYHHYKKILDKLKITPWFERVEMPICQLLIETETWGVALDKDQLKRIKKEAYAEIEKLEKDIHQTIGYEFNVGSSTQLAKALFDDMGIGMRPDGTNEFTLKGKSKVWSTNEEVLNSILRSDCTINWPPVDPPQKPNELRAAHVASLILKHREITTRLNTFIRPLLERCRGNSSCIIHPRFIQVGTVTGRFASRDPNYQNLPRKGGVRAGFVSRPGYKIVRADYCVSGSTFIDTVRGKIKIVDIVPGDQVLLESGELATVAEVIDRGKLPVVELATRKGALRATKLHRIRVLDYHGNYVWKRIGELSATDKVAMQLNPLAGWSNIQYEHIYEVTDLGFEENVYDLVVPGPMTYISNGFISHNSQAELRLMAHMSCDPVMIDIYLSNGDIHQRTADACKVTRQAAKALNFGLVYRMSANRLKGQLAMEGIMITLDEAIAYVRRYFSTYRKVKDYHKLVEKTVKARLDDQGEPFFGEFGWVRTLGGRYRRLDRQYLLDPRTEYPAVTQCINTTIQGGVSDLIKVSMVDIWRELQLSGWLNPERDIWDAVIQGQVHDEIFLEVKEEIAEQVSVLVSEKMVRAGEKFKIKVPMLADAAIVDSLAKG